MNESVKPTLEIDAQSKKLAYFFYHQLYHILNFFQFEFTQEFQKSLKILYRKSTWSLTP